MPERRATASALLDALVFGSFWVGFAAAALCAASAHAMEIPVEPAVLGLAFCGTLVVYTVDRLRDLARDRATSPQRSAFVERHRRTLAGLAAASALASFSLGIVAGWRVVGVAGGVLALGLAHRRLKQHLWAKPFYLTLSWVAVTVGLPAAADPAARHLLPVAGIVGLTVQSNVMLSNLRDREGAAARLGRRRALLLAGALLLAAAGLALRGPPSLGPLVCLPAAMGMAVAGFRPGERYGLVAVDGALLAGALVAVAASLRSG